jgi:transcriptional regulator with XRE-family HTH domain
MTKRSIAVERRKLQALPREIRQEAGIRQADMAKKLGRNQTIVSNYELGHHRLDLSGIRQVCGVVGLEPLDFFQRFEAFLKEKSRPSDLENHRRIHKPKRHGRQSPLADVCGDSGSHGLSRILARMFMGEL